MGKKGSRWRHRKTIAQRLMADSIEEPNTGCWIWLGYRNRSGYGQLTVWDSTAGRRMQKIAHRLAFEAWVGPIQEGMLACHSCDNPPCINPKHLFAGTPKDNTVDMYQKGRQKPCKGERHGLNRYSGEFIMAVKDALVLGEYQRDIAARFGISQSHVSRIKNAQTWKHVLEAS